MIGAHLVIAVQQYRLNVKGSSRQLSVVVLHTRHDQGWPSGCTMSKTCLGLVVFTSIPDCGSRTMFPTSCCVSRPACAMLVCQYTTWAEPSRCATTMPGLARGSLPSRPVQSLPCIGTSNTCLNPFVPSYLYESASQRVRSWRSHLQHIPRRMQTTETDNDRHHRLMYSQDAIYPLCRGGRFRVPGTKIDVGSALVLPG